MFKTLEELKAKVIEVTLGAIEKKEEPSEKARKLAAILSRFGEYKEKAIGLVEILINEKLPTNSLLDGYEKFIAIVPEANENSHDYPLYVPCIIYCPESAFAINIEMKTGNHLPKDPIKDVRLATETEIEMLFSIWQEKIDMGKNFENIMEYLDYSPAA